MGRMIRKFMAVKHLKDPKGLLEYLVGMAGRDLLIGGCSVERGRQD